MIGISAQTYDLEGAWVFEHTDPDRDARNRAGDRRISRTATLDGGVAITDLGYSDGDRTLVLSVPGATLEEVEFAEYICRTYGLVNVATADGAYSAATESHKLEDGELTLTLLVKEKLSA